MSHGSQSWSNDELLANVAFVRSLARSMLDEHSADDVAQEALLATLTRPPRTGTRIRAWLAVVVKNLARRARRGSERRARREKLAARDEALPSSVEVSERLETAERLVAAVRTLDELSRRTIMLRFFENLTCEAIARREGASPATVRARLSRGLARLRERLDREGTDRISWRLALLPLVTANDVALNSGGASLLTGAIAMSVATKTGLLATALLVITAAALWWRGWRDDASPIRTPTAQTTVELGAHAAQRDEAPAPTRVPLAADARSFDRDLDVFGRVVDDSHAPIAGARVSATFDPRYRVALLDREEHAAVAPLTRATTRDDGTFALRLERGLQIDLEVVAPGYAPRHAHCLAGERVEIVLSRPSSLEVTAVDELNQPVRDVHVRFVRNDSHLGDATTATTSADGRARFADLAAGVGQVILEHARLASVWQRVEIAPANTTSVTVTLPEGRAIRGRVVDAVTHAPIARARVGAGWAFGRAVATDLDGGYTYLGWTGRGESELHAAAEGYGRTSKLAPLDGTVDFALWPGDEVRGQVMSVGHEPIAGALISAIAYETREGVQLGDSCTVNATADGSFQITSLRRDLPHTLVVQAHGHARLLLDFDPHPQWAGVIELGEIVLPAARRLEGVASDADGKPISAANVTLVGHNDDRGRLRPKAMKPAVDCYYGASEWCRTDDLGRFRFCDLAPGTYELTLSVDGTPPARKNVVIPADRDLLDLELRIARGCALTARVTSEDGEPIKGAGLRVRIAGERGSVIAVTSEEGLATLRGLPAAEVDVEVSAYPDWITHAPIKVTPAGQEIAVVLLAAGVIDGVVLGADDQPVARIEVEASDGEEHTWHTIAGDDGKFEMRAPRGAVVDLTVSGRRYRSIKSESSTMVPQDTPLTGELRGVEVPAHDIVLHVRPRPLDGVIEVRVVDPDGNPFAGANVVATGSGSYVRGTSDEAGRVTLKGLPREPVWVSAIPRNEHMTGADPLWGSGRKKIAPAAEPVTLMLRRADRLTVRVLDPAGEPVPHAQVQVAEPSGEFSVGSTDHEGRFSVPVPRGEPALIQVTDATLTLSGELRDVAASAGVVTVRLTKRDGAR